MKIEASDFTIVIPLFPESKERVENLNMLLSWFDAWTNANVLLGLPPNIEIQVKPYKNIKVDVMTTCDLVDGQYIYRTRMINELLLASKTRFAAFWDTDMVLTLAQLAQAFTSVRKGDFDIVWPFSEPTKEVSPEGKETFASTKRIEKVSSSYVNRQYESEKVIAGGCAVFNRLRFLAAGGFNEKFISWGPEDNEMFHRFVRFDLTIGRLAGDLFHLSHPRGPNSGNDNPYSAKNWGYLEEFLACTNHLEYLTGMSLGGIPLDKVGEADIELGKEIETLKRHLE